MTKTYLDSCNRPAEPPEPETPSDDDIISLAKRKYNSDNIQIYSDTKVDPVDEGAWVEAWVWVPYPENDS
jgi:hypothetical protein